MPRAELEAEESVWSLAAFWLIAFGAAFLFAAVLIAPKWDQHELLDARVRGLSNRCQHLSGLNDHLARTVAALKHDPEFMGEMARWELDYVSPEEQRLPAPPRHPHAAQPPCVETPAGTAWKPILLLFARDRVVRRAALGSAAVFAIIALACFNPPAGRTAGGEARNPRQARARLP